MKIAPFKLETYFAEHEFSVPHLLCMSDCEPFNMREVLELADEECQELWETLSLGYTETAGLPLLLEEIGKLYRGAHVHTHAGAEEAIYCTMQTLLEPGDHVVVFTPCYQSLLELPRAISGNVTEVPLREELGWRPDWGELERVVTPATRMIVCNFPHNPTGAQLTSEEQQRLLAIAGDAYVVCDEVYRGIEIAPAPHPIADVSPRGVSINVMTKAFGLGGLRIGWLASQDEEVIEKVANYKHYTSICNSAPSEVLALIALRRATTLLERNLSIVLKNLELIDAFLERQPNFSWRRPQGGATGFVRVEGVDVEELAERARKEAGILLLPASIYGHPSNHFRIGFGRRNFPDVLGHFENWLK